MTTMTVPRVLPVRRYARLYRVTEIQTAPGLAEIFFCYRNRRGSCFLLALPMSFLFFQFAF